MGVMRNHLLKVIVFQIFKKLVMTEKLVKSRLRNKSAAF